jgi:predicted NUDIX family phosphoesterase
MNPVALAEFNEALERAKEGHADQFEFLQVDTSASKNVVETNVRLLGQLLPIVERWANPEVAVVPRAVVQKQFKDAKFHGARAARIVWKNLSANIQWRHRYEAEQSEDCVQLVACGVPLNDTRVLVLERDQADRKAASYGRLTLWKGCHLERASTESARGMEMVTRCLKERLRGDLHLEIPMDFDLIGTAYDSEADAKHLGIMFWLPIEDDEVVRSMHAKEFRRSGRGSTLTGSFRTQEEILSEFDESDLEPWSLHVISNLKVKDD